MSGAFIRALDQRFPADSSNPQTRVWRDYAASTNERGLGVVAKLKDFGPLRPGARLLDVGSGYGGVCIAAAEQGLEAVGIEPEPVQLQLSLENKADHPELRVELSGRDAMQWDSLASLGVFDFITCDNVVEHVPNPPVLFAHLRRLLAPGGLLYLTAPNARSFGQIASDCHYSLFGVSLLDPLDGEAYVRERGHSSYDVSTYYPLAEYQSLFARYGLHTKLLNPPGDVEAEVAAVAEARRRVDEQAAGVVLPAPVDTKVRRALKQHLAAVDADLEFFRQLPRGPARDDFGRWLHRTAVVELWYWAASPDPQRFAPPAPAPRPPPPRPEPSPGEELWSLVKRAVRTR